MYLVLGLGNPGESYENTRHNTGFRVLDLWCRDLGVRLARKRFQSRLARAAVARKELVLACPLTFMNRSGEAARRIADFYRVALDHILVVHDDLDLPVGRLKVARNGGAGGHRGVRSVIEHLGSPHFARIKIGIGRPPSGDSAEDFVLRPFSADERVVIEKVLRLGARACELFVTKGVDEAMNRVNCQNLGEKEERS